MSTESLMIPNHLILGRPLLLLPLIFPIIRVFLNELAICIKWPKYRNFSISPSNEYWLISMNKGSWFPWIKVTMNKGWFPLGLIGLISLQSKELSRIFSSITIQKHQSFSTQPSLWSNSHVHTWPLEKLYLTIQTFVSKAMPLLFNMLSRCVIAFLPGSKHLLISWLQSQSAVILEPKKRKSATTSTFSPSVCHDLSFLNAEF